MSLMEGISKVVAVKASENHIRTVTKIKLVVGKLTNALPDALQMAFEVLRREEGIFDSEAALEIEVKPTIGKCNQCLQEFMIEDNYSFLCPECNNFDVTIVSGRELFVDYFEGE